MSLTDADKTNGNRAQPVLNVEDKVNVEAVRAHGAEAMAYRSEDAIGTACVIKKDDQIIVFDGSFNKALFGRDGNGEYVVKVAQDGVDVLTATDAQLIFNSDRNLFKIVDSGTASISHVHGTINSAVTTTVAHGQSGTPIVIAYANSLVAPGVPGTPSRQLPFLYPAISGGSMVIGTFLYHSSTSTNIEFTSWSANLTTISASIKYYILQETAN